MALSVGDEAETTAMEHNRLTGESNHNAIS